MRSPAIAFAVFLAVHGLPVTGSAQVRAGPSAHVFEVPPAVGVLPASPLDGLRVAPFEPLDPEVGPALALAYAPSPLLLVDGIVGADAGTGLTLSELAVGLVGAAVAAGAFVDVQMREPPSDVSIASIATAHALAWNLELATRALVRLRFSVAEGDPLVPTFFAVPVMGGATVSPRWTW